MEGMGRGAMVKGVPNHWDEKHNFLFIMLRNREPVKLDENRCSMVSRLGADDDCRCRLLYWS